MAEAPKAAKPEAVPAKPPKAPEPEAAELEPPSPEEPKGEDEAAPPVKKRSRRWIEEPPTPHLSRSPTIRSKSLIEAMRKSMYDVLRFTTDKAFPFMGDHGTESELRLPFLKNQVVGDFKSIENADDFCLIRSYLLTCARHGLRPLESLRILFRDRLPDFIAPEGPADSAPPPEAAG